LFAADCISIERREGTLALLFLTPLKARQIVLSKGFVHGLRALTLWLSATPILTIAFLIGGLSWKEIVMSVCANFSSICFALAAGILASSASKSWLRAMILAGLLAFIFFLGLVALFGICFIVAMIGRGNYTSYPYSFTIEPTNFLQAGYVGLTDMDGLWGKVLGTLTLPQQRNWLIADGVTAAVSFLFLMFIVYGAAWEVRRNWREEPPSARRIFINKVFFTPVVGVSFFRRWLRGKLERNPIGWLEQRTWSGRLVTWGWFAVMVSFYSFAFEIPNSDRMLADLQGILGWGLLFLIAVCASASFQRERETRVLELLLVSPMREWSIIEGRLRGLWGQFLPTFALLIIVWLYLAELFRPRGNFALIPLICGGYATLPVIGLHYSLRRANFISALLSTLFMGLVVPELLRLFCQILVQIVFWSDDYQSSRRWLYLALDYVSSSPLFICAMQALIAFLVGKKLYQNLVHRNFSYSKTSG
jgi:ABC-type transport system involved in multi-copper enzyme maturation permease subunit